MEFHSLGDALDSNNVFIVVPTSLQDDTLSKFHGPGNSGGSKSKIAEFNVTIFAVTSDWHHYSVRKKEKRIYIVQFADSNI